MTDELPQRFPGLGSKTGRGLALAFLFLLLGGIALAQRPAPRAAQRFPNILVVTIDTLRADRLSAYGYRRPTSPQIDRLLAAGARFTQARTVEPLTNPSLCSLWTSVHPHEHGATRNGLRLRPDATSAARLLDRRGFQTAAFVGNWTLRNGISGLGEHFGHYGEVFTRKRWLGLFKGEATAEDLTDAALDWLGERRETAARRPFLLWVHYVEPHAPYRLQESFAPRLGISTTREASRSDRYDTEIAFADYHVGRLLNAIQGDPDVAANTLIVFTADHGESLGEHSYWGHGRNLFEPTLHIPLGIVWPGRIRPGTTIEAPALNIDVAPTLLGLAGLPIPAGFAGFDWTAVLRGTAQPPRARTMWFQAHKGAVLSPQEAESARRKGLLEIAVLSVPEMRKEIFRIGEHKRTVFDLVRDPRELHNLAAGAASPSQGLQAWLNGLRQGLADSDRLAKGTIAPEDVKALQALGYAE
jgi:arylsulfatase A-like enzyme